MMDSGANPESGHRRRESSDESPSSQDAADLAFAKRLCCSFSIPCFGSKNKTWQNISTEERSGGGGDGRWWKRAALKVREWSEIVAGPRWKTFIRQFKRKNPRWGGGGGARPGGNKFQYDPLSYALNFDEGQNGGDSDEDLTVRNFSTRYAVPPASSKSSVDLGGQDAPSLFAAA